MLKSVSLIPVVDEAKPDIGPCITFHFFSETGALFGGGAATEESASCQVDIWYKKKEEKVSTTIARIKRAIADNRLCSYPEKDYIYESGNKIHHTYFTFNLIIESEE